MANECLWFVLKKKSCGAIQLSSGVKKNASKEMTGGLSKLIMGAPIINISLLGAVAKPGSGNLKNIPSDSFNNTCFKSLNQEMPFSFFLKFMIQVSGITHGE